MGKAAHRFCKDIKRRRESLDCSKNSDEANNWVDANPLIVAISIEPQRANNGMILERAPHTENLIEANNVKCMQSVAIKRHRAIESLRSKQLKPIKGFESEVGKTLRTESAKFL